MIDRPWSDLFSASDLVLLAESLRYTRLAFEGYQYPTYEFKQQRLAEVDAVALKVNAARKALRVEAQKEDA